MMGFFNKASANNKKMQSLEEEEALRKKIERQAFDQEKNEGDGEVEGWGGGFAAAAAPSAYMMHME